MPGARGAAASAGERGARADEKRKAAGARAEPGDARLREAGLETEGRREAATSDGERAKGGQAGREGRSEGQLSEEVLIPRGTKGQSG